MGCSISRIDQLPAVSLCHDRCKFLEEALYQSYALADAHVAYMHSLKSLGPALHRFFDEALINNQSDSQSNGDSAAVTKLSKPSSPDIFCPSSSTNSETSHIDFRSDSEDEEFKDNKDLDSLHRVHKSQFNPFSYDHLDDNEYDYPAWKTPPPPAPSSSEILAKGFARIARFQRCTARQGQPLGRFGDLPDDERFQTGEKRQPTQDHAQV